MSNILNLNDLLDKIPESIDSINDAEKYSAKFLKWGKISEIELANFTEVGGIDQEKENANFNQVDDYWSEQGKVDFKKYPFNSIKVYKQNNANNFYGVYRESGGHVTELRCRIIQKKLVMRNF